MDENKVIALVRQRLQGRRLGDITIDVLDHPIRQKDNFWYIPTCPSRQPPRTFEYYDMLAEVETELSLEDHLDVLLVPTIPE